MCVRCGGACDCFECGNEAGADLIARPTERAVVAPHQQIEQLLENVCIKVN
jgi:hypothetical protein